MAMSFCSSVNNNNNSCCYYFFLIFIIFYIIIVIIQTHIFGLWLVRIHSFCHKSPRTVHRSFNQSAADPIPQADTSLLRIRLCKGDEGSGSYIVRYGPSGRRFGRCITRPAIEDI